MKKIGMVVAMQSEVESFLSARDLSVKHTKNGGFDIISFNIGKNQIICVQSGVGEIYAAAATQMLISVYGVDAVINFGVCGSLIDDIVVGEVVLVEGVIHYDFDTSAIDDCGWKVYAISRTHASSRRRAYKSRCGTFPCDY